MMAKPALRIVEPLAVSAGKPVAPERRLRSLFRSEARLQRELIETRQQIAAERARYASKHGLLINPALDTLRRLFA